MQATSIITGAPSATIHVVDDDDSVRRALMRLLGVAGFDARGYASAEQFLSAVKGGAHGCVILDVNMPGTGGLELQRLMAYEHSALPIIFVSGHSDERASAQAIEAGAVAFLDKPIDRNALMRAIERALSHAP